MFDDLWNRYCGQLDCDLMAYAEQLAPTYRLAIVSNSGDGARRGEEKRFGLSRLFDPIVYSHEVQVAKPDRQIFELTTGLLGAAPEEVAFVDDSPENVESADRFGWHAVVHVDTPTTIATLNELLH